MQLVLGIEGVFVSMLHFIRVLSAILIFCSTAHAADIEILGNQVLLSGEIVEGDSERFEKATNNLPEGTIIRLASSGGLAIEGLVIGSHVRKQGFKTYVHYGDCVSSCAIIWLAGIERWKNSNARIGFHGVYDRDTGNASGPGNAFVGHYLANLGLSPDAVYFITAPASDEVSWLTPEEGKKVGIEYRQGQPGDANQSTKRTIPERKTEAERFVPEVFARNFMQNFFELTSLSNQRLFAIFPKLYAEEVDYFGEKRSRSYVLEDKLRYLKRWPIRTYVPRDSTTRVECFDFICEVSGILDYVVSSPDRRKEASGAVEYIYVVNVATEQILLEKSSRYEPPSDKSYTPLSGVTRHESNEITLRTGPNRNNRSIRIFRNGVPVKILGKSNRWYRVKIGKIQGYVHVTSLKVDQFFDGGYSNKHIQIKSHRTLSEVFEYARDFEFKVSAFSTTNGWYAITLNGTYPWREAENILRNLLIQRKIPNDSVTTHGNTYIKQVCCDYSQ